MTGPAFLQSQASASPANARNHFGQKSTIFAVFFLVQKYQNGKNIPNGHKLYQTSMKYTKWP
jgi:hypothetical protein